MRHFPLLILLASLAACAVFPEKNNSSAHPGLRSLDRKMEPFDQFTFQRTFPDRALDWQAYHRAVERSTAREAALRAANPCTGRLPNWTLQGPANVGGRVNSLVIKPDNENTLLAAFSAGGIFKTTDGGQNWRPVFDEHLNLSIGDLTFDPSNPNTIYAGTGDPNMPGVVFNGSGIFKSTDAGEHWTYLGLAHAGIISKVEISPTNPNVLFAAAMGNPYVRNAERGVYKSTNGGQTWQQVLFVDDQAGASDLIMNPSNPQILYASFWDRIRSSTESIIDGPNAKIYKTTNGGQTWTELGGGLPTVRFGRTGLAMSKQDPNKLYAVYIDSTSSRPYIYKTTDGGTTWNSLNTIGLHSSLGGFGWYFGKLRVNPSNDDDLYFLAIQLWRKAPGTTQFALHGGMHADVHDLVFAPSGTRYSGTDGGVYRNNPGQGPWTRCKNLPTTQFYHVNYSQWETNKWYAGAQDNGINRGNATELNNWENMIAADGFTTQFHPWDGFVIWAMTQNGTLNRSSDGGANWQIGQTCLGLNANERCNWDTPFFVSKHQNSQYMFAASQRVHQTDANGQPNWVSISGDLTDGNIYGARFHTISCLGESPIIPLKLMAGTSDGNVWRREPTGPWVNLNVGLPNRYVTSVHLSPTVENRLYVTHAGWRDNEYIPHLHRSDNNGVTWFDISGDLPQFPVNDLLVLPGRLDSVLLAATDVGVYFSKNYGASWDRLGGNMPNVPVFDLERNPAKKTIAAASYARGVWTMHEDSIFVQSPAQEVALAGEVKTASGQGIENVQVASTTTDDTGVFSMFDLAACQDFLLRPYRNDDPLNGVSTFDLLLISKHILGVEPLNTPLKMLAADANRSGTITSFDIVALRKLILGIDTAFLGNTSWRFLPKDFSFANPANPFAGGPVPDSILFNSQDPNADFSPDFIGFKVGDVNGNAVPNLQSGGDDRDAILPAIEIAERRPTAPILLKNKQFQAGEMVEAIFKLPISGLAALQFSLQADGQLLEIASVEPLFPGLSAEHFGLKKQEQGFLTFCFEPGETTSASFSNFEKTATSDAHTEPLFKVVFRAKKSGELSRALAINSSLTAALAYRAGGETLRPALVFEDQTTGNQVFVSPTLVGSAGSTAHVFLKNDTENVTLELVDASGRLVYSKSQNLPAGEHLVDLPAAVFTSAGAYFLKIGAGGKWFEVLLFKR